MYHHIFKRACLIMGWTTCCKYFNRIFSSNVVVFLVNIYWFPIENGNFPACHVSLPEVFFQRPTTPFRTLEHLQSRHWKVWWPEGLAKMAAEELELSVQERLRKWGATWNKQLEIQTGCELWGYSPEKSDSSNLIWLILCNLSKNLIQPLTSYKDPY